MADYLDFPTDISGWAGSIYFPDIDWSNWGSWDWDLGNLGNVFDVGGKTIFDIPSYDISDWAGSLSDWTGTNIYGIPTESSGFNISKLLGEIGGAISPVLKYLIPFLGMGGIGLGAYLKAKEAAQPKGPTIQTIEKTQSPNITQVIKNERSTVTESGSRWASETIKYLFPEDELRKFVMDYMKNSEEAIKKAKNIPHLTEAEKMIMDRVINAILTGTNPEKIAASEMLRQLFYTGKLPAEWEKAEQLLKEGIDPVKVRQQIASVLGPMLGTYGRAPSIASRTISDIIEQNKKALANFYLQKAAALEALEKEALATRARAAQLYPQLALGPTSFARYIQPAAYEKAALADWLANFKATNQMLADAIRLALTKTGSTTAGGETSTRYAETIGGPTTISYSLGPDITKIITEGGAAGASPTNLFWSSMLPALSQALISLLPDTYKILLGGKV